MNERIQELIQMADLCAASLMASGATEEEIQNRSKVVLAELIVRECSTIADKWVDDTDNGQNYPSETIKQHFGVES